MIVHLPDNLLLVLSAWKAPLSISGAFFVSDIVCNPLRLKSLIAFVKNQC